jgi:hypothetical protein
MMDNKLQMELPENKKPVATEDQELDYWSEEFGISREELEETVKAGGTSTEAVEKYVKRVKFFV